MLKKVSKLSKIRWVSKISRHSGAGSGPQNLKFAPRTQISNFVCFLPARGCPTSIRNTPQVSEKAPEVPTKNMTCESKSIHCFCSVNRIFEKEIEVLRGREYADWRRDILLYLLNWSDLKKVHSASSYGHFTETYDLRIQVDSSFLFSKSHFGKRN